MEPTLWEINNKFLMCRFCEILGGCFAEHQQPEFDVVLVGAPKNNRLKSYVV